MNCWDGIFPDMMLSGSRNFLWIIPLAVLVAGPLWKPALESFLSPHGNLRVETGESIPDKSMWLTDVRMSRHEDGRIDLLLSAATVRSGRMGVDTLHMEKVDAFLLDKKGRERAHISGGEGFYDGGKQILTLVEDAAVVVKNRYELRTDALRYLIEFKTVKTAADIFFKSRDFSVRGTGMSYDLESGAYRVGGRLVCKVK